jgi:hypothetical protein
MIYLTHLLYVSRATSVVSADDLNALSARSAVRNSSASVTGMLLYSRGSFLQLLEGRAAVLDALFKRILADPRHTDVQVLLKAPAPNRLFPRWYMGALNLDLTGTQVDRDRLAEALRERPDPPPSGERVLAVLREFRHQLPAPVATSGV